MSRRRIRALAALSPRGRGQDERPCRAGPALTACYGRLFSACDGVSENHGDHLRRAQLGKSPNIYWVTWWFVHLHFCTLAQLSVCTFEQLNVRASNSLRSVAPTSVSGATRAERSRDASLMSRCARKLSARQSACAARRPRMASGVIPQDQPRIGSNGPCVEPWKAILCHSGASNDRGAAAAAVRPNDARLRMSAPPQQAAMVRRDRGWVRGVPLNETAPAVAQDYFPEFSS